MLSDLGFEQKNPTIVCEDNQGAIALATNPRYHARTKHVDVRYHFIREKITTGLIEVMYSGALRAEISLSGSGWGSGH